MRKKKGRGKDAMDAGGACSKGAWPWKKLGGHGEEHDSLRAAAVNREEETCWLKEEERVAARGVDANFPNCKGRHFYL